MNDTNPTVLLIDNQGLSHYTCYLATGLSRYKKIKLIGFSREDYIFTDACSQTNIDFMNLEDLVFKNRSLWKMLIQKPFSIFRRLINPVLFTNYKVIHLQGHLPLFFLYIFIIKLKRRKLVWTIHDVDLRPSSGGIRGKLEILYMSLITQPKLLSTNADLLLVHGNNLKTNLIRKGVSASKIQIIPHFDYLYLQKYSKGDFSYEKERQYILFFGNIKPYKGLDVFLKALDIVERDIGSGMLRVLIAGKGDLKPYQSLLTKDKLNYIEIRNEDIPTEEIADIFQHSMSVILPYLDASQSGIVPLAYTFSKPVIVSDVGSLSEFVEHEKTGYVFENGNFQELAKLIVRTISDPVTTLRMGENAHEKLISQMSLEICSNTINKMYDEISS